MHDLDFDLVCLGASFYGCSAKFRNLFHGFRINLKNVMPCLVISQRIEAPVKHPDESGFNSLSRNHACGVAGSK